VEIYACSPTEAMQAYAKTMRLAPFSAFEAGKCPLGADDGMDAQNSPLRPNAGYRSRIITPESELSDRAPGCIPALMFLSMALFCGWSAWNLWFTWGGLASR
jgi:hypothetical protein